MFATINAKATLFVRSKNRVELVATRRSRVRRLVSTKRAWSSEFFVSNDSRGDYQRRQLALGFSPFPPPTPPSRVLLVMRVSRARASVADSIEFLSTGETSTNVK